MRWPAKGVVKRWAYQDQPPFSSPDALNVRPDAAMEGRAVGGTRPGVGKSHKTQLGSGNPVRGAETVTYTRQDGFKFWMDRFPGDELSSLWATASWIGTELPVTDNRYASIAYDAIGGEVRSALADLDVSSTYEIALFIAPYDAGSGLAHHGSYSVFARMDDTTPIATTAGIEARMDITGVTGVYSGTLDVYVASVKTSYAFNTGNHGAALAGWLVVNIAADTVTVTWRGTELVSQAISAAAGERFGFGIECTESGGLCLVDTFLIEYNSSVTQESKWPLLVVTSNGVLSKETNIDTFTVVSSSLTLISDRHIHGFEAFQKLYWLDHGDYLTEQTDGVIASNGIDLSSATIGSGFAALGIDTDDDIVVIEDASDDAAEVTRAIASQTASKLVLTPAATQATSCEFRVERGPKVYDPILNTLSLWIATAGKGEVPTGCPAGCLYRGRAVLAGNKRHPNLWWMSRQNDFNDWNYDATDAQRAVAGLPDKYGKLGEPCNAVISHNDDLCLFGCVNSLWVMRGDPTFGGRIDNLSHRIGVIHRRSWCYLPDTSLMFLSRDGVYRLAPGANTYPEAVSRKVLPADLRYVDTNDYDVFMAWDNDYRGCHIYLTATTAAGNQHWWFDLDTGGFWPVAFGNTDHEPTAICEYQSLNVRSSGVLLGCRDGYMRRYRDEWETDEGTEITSYVTFGPLRLWDELYDGVLQQVDATLATTSGEVTLDVRVGTAPEAAVDADAFGSKTLAAGRNNTWRPRARASAAIIRLENSDTDRRWAFEGMSAIIERGGRHRH